VATAPAATATAIAATTTAAQTTSATTATAVSTAQATTAASSDLAPPDQQVLRIAWNEPATLDLPAIFAANDAAIAEQLFTGLTRLGPDLTPQPAIAASWKFNADNTQVTFTLRDTQWSDGKPLTAQDFAYAWRRTVDPQSASPGVVLTGGIIKGEKALSTTPVSDTAKLQQARANFGVKALDARTLQVTLEKPAPFFLSLAATVGLAPLRQDGIEQSGAKWATAGHLIGNGPFVLKSWTKGSELTLAPNPHYYAGPPKLTALTLTFVTDFGVSFASFQAGALDISYVPAPEVVRVRTDPQFKDQAVDIPNLGTFMLGWNTTKPPFNNIKVRQAFAAAIDRQTIVQQVVHGVGMPAYSFVPPGMPGHLTEAEAGDAAQRYDPAKAKRLLAEAGYPNGRGFPELKLAFVTGGTFPLIIQRAQADLQNTLGVKITLEPRGSSMGTYGSSLYKNPPDFFFIGWRADFPDPYNFDVEALAPGADPGKWQNAEFTRLTTEADRQTDPAKRIALYKQAEKIAVGDAARIFVYWFGTLRLVKPYVKGLTTTAQDAIPGQYFLKDVYIVKH
jgi:oligopeptide transport system substrate-binding protein